MNGVTSRFLNHVFLLIVSGKVSEFDFPRFDFCFRFKFISFYFNKRKETSDHQKRKLKWRENSWITINLKVDFKIKNSEQNKMRFELVFIN